LSGVQGVLHSAFLIRAGLRKKSFIATAVVVSTFVDFARLSAYATQISNAGLLDNVPLIISATVVGILGSYIGNRLLKKVTFRFIQVLVGVMFILVALGLGSGLI